ncbi:MAG: hypothetical protein D6772_14480 [Bacteroidetes bacterium]|nr:MAG: hypothetical protein D6772_14480 [Bacteroidota bacterium]
MRGIELFSLSIERLVLRFYCFMALVLLTGFMHLDWFWVVTIGMISFISSLIGLSYPQRTDRQNRPSRQWPKVFDVLFPRDKLSQTPSFSFSAETRAIS